MYNIITVREEPKPKKPLQKPLGGRKKMTYYDKIFENENEKKIVIEAREKQPKHWSELTVSQKIVRGLVDRSVGFAQLYKLCETLDSPCPEEMYAPLVAFMADKWKDGMEEMLCYVLKYKLEHCSNMLDEAGEIARKIFCRILDEEIEIYCSPLDELIKEYEKM